MFVELRISWSQNEENLRSILFFWFKMFNCTTNEGIKVSVKLNLQIQMEITIKCEIAYFYKNSSTYLFPKVAAAAAACWWIFLDDGLVFRLE